MRKFGYSIHKERSLGCVAPSKFYGYLAAGKPLAICPRNCYLKDLIIKKELGSWTANGDFEELASFIINLRNSKTMQKQLKANCLNYLNENASLKIISENYFKLYKSICNYDLYLNDTHFNKNIRHNITRNKIS